MDEIEHAGARAEVLRAGDGAVGAHQRHRLRGGVSSARRGVVYTVLTSTVDASVFRLRLSVANAQLSLSAARSRADGAKKADPVRGVEKSRSRSWRPAGSPMNMRSSIRSITDR